MKQWPKDVPQSLDYPEFSLGQVLRNAAAESPDHVAIRFLGTSMSFAELDSQADRFGEALQNLGIVKGDRVAIYLPNTPQFVIAYYGTLRIGAIVVACSPLYKERELAQILTDSGARALVSLDSLQPYVDAARGKIRPLHVITTSLRDYMPVELASRMTGAQVPTPKDAEDLKTLLGQCTGRIANVEIEPRKDIALLQYTGGTTGTPKAAMLTHFNMVVNAAQVAAWAYMKAGKEVHLAVLPLCHIYGMTATMNAPIYTRSTIVLIPDPRNVKAVLEAANKYRPTFFCGVPAMYVALINLPNIKDHDLRSIRACISGASPLPVKVQKAFEELTGGRLVEGYGLTEAAPVTHINPLDDRNNNRTGSIGLPISDTDAKIVDSETGTQELPPGTPGELVVRGPQVMTGYWNKPEESDMILRDGWLCTGDIAIMDPDGYFRIVDRKKDMINVSGLKVWPNEVEQILFEHPAVKEASVVGVPDSESGEAVKAFLVLKDEYRGKVDPAEFKKFCKDRISPYKAPKIVEFRPELPKTPVGKVLRRELRAARET